MDDAPLPAAAAAAAAGGRTAREELFGGRRDRKRTYDQMSQDSSSATTPSSASTRHAARQSASSSLNQRFPPPAPSPSSRYPGDGLDFRRPVMSTSTAANDSDVIDLTDESEVQAVPSTTIPHSHPAPRHWRSRPPDDVGRRSATRPARQTAPDEPEVIELDDEDEPLGTRSPGTNLLGTRGRRESSAEVEFLYAHRSASREAPRQRPEPVEPRLLQDAGQQRSLFSVPMDLMRSVANITRMSNFGFGLGDSYLAQQPRTTSRRDRHSRRYAAYGIAEPYRIPTTNFDEPVSADSFHMPTFNYHDAAFSLSTGQHTATPPVPTYTKPAPARDGFTRGPQEDEAVVCPSCDQELGTGENETKRQIWAIRSCGHVYCGECARLRSKRGKQARGDSAGQPFTKCVVDGCGKTKTSGNKSMFQVYI